ncbi:MAG: arsenate reductase ArsC [Hellea sp.]|nr:arsenate reductase ArsC [Hellea sp.]
MDRCLGYSLQTKMINVLFLCTGNSARSIISEVLLRDLGAGRFQSFSAGSRPSGKPHPDGINELVSRGHDTAAIRSKSWDEFASIDSPRMDIIVTVCGSAASEVCPIWPSNSGDAPMTVHWGIDNPAYVEPRAERKKAFSNVYRICRRRIEAFIALDNEDICNRDAVQSVEQII